MPTKTKVKTKSIVYLREKIIHSRKPDITPHQVILEEIPAEYLNESDADICNVCHEPQEGHVKRGRIHSYIPIHPTGADLRVHFPEEIGGTVILHHIQEGDTANCWKEQS